MSSRADETYRSLISIAQEGFKYLTLCNGGAIVALLAYLGNVAGKSIQPVDLKCPLILLVCGLICCGLSMMFAYWTQYQLHNEIRDQENCNTSNRIVAKPHKSSLLWGAIFFASSMLFFSIGALIAGFRFTG